MRFASLLTVCGLLVITGCGGSGRPSLVQVTGTVKLDGQPLDGAFVSLKPIVSDPKASFQRPSSGITGPDGKFTAGTYDKSDGLPVGKYKVGVIKREPIGELPEGYNSETAENFNVTFKWITPRAVASPDASGLEVEVTSSGMKPDVIELKSVGQPELEQTGPQRNLGP